MQNTAVQNIKIFLKAYKISDYRFAEDTGLSKRYLSKVKHMSDETLRKVHAAYPSLNLHWVVTGKGPMEFPTK